MTEVRRVRRIIRKIDAWTVFKVSSIFWAIAALGLDFGRRDAFRPGDTLRFGVALPRVAEIPFDSERKLMTTLHRDGSAVIAYTKGAPEVVLQRCEDQLTAGGRAAPKRKQAGPRAKRRSGAPGTAVKPKRAAQ